MQALILRIHQCLIFVFRYIRQHTKPSRKYDKQTRNAKRLLLIYPRSISFESNRGSGSARHGWLQALSTCTITLKMPQAPQGLNSRKKTYCFRFWFSKMKAPGRDVLRAHRSPWRILLEQLLAHIVKVGMANIFAFNQIDNVFANITGVICNALKRACAPAHIEGMTYIARIFHHVGNE